MTTAAPAPAPAAAPVTFPGKTLGIIGLILAFVFSLAGIIVSAIARSQSKKAGFKNTPATVGLVLSIIFFILTTIIVGTSIAGAIAALSYANQICSEYGLGEWVTENGVTVTCG